MQLPDAEDEELSVKPLLRRLWARWQFHAATTVFALALLALEWTGGPHPGGIAIFAPHETALIAWLVFVIAAAIATYSAWRNTPVLKHKESRVDVEKGGFRVTARSAVAHRFQFAAGEHVRIGTTATLYLGLAWLGLEASYARLGEPIGVSLVFAMILVPFVVPVAAYVALQTRRSIVVTRDAFTVRDWTGWSRRLELGEDVRLVIRDVGEAYVIEASAGGIQLHVVRLLKDEAFVLDEQLRAAISEVCGVTLPQELVVPPAIAKWNATQRR